MRMYSLYHRDKGSQCWIRIKREDGVTPLLAFPKHRAVHIYQDRMLDALAQPGSVELRPVPYGLN